MMEKAFIIGVEHAYLSIKRKRTNEKNSNKSMYHYCWYAKIFSFFLSFFSYEFSNTIPETNDDDDDDDATIKIETDPESNNENNNNNNNKIMNSR